MASDLTPTERQLGTRLAALRSAAERPNIVGGGLVGETLNFISERLPVLVIRAAALVFVAYHAWGYYAQAQQLVSQVAATNAEAVRDEVEAQALNQKLGMNPAQREAKLAELAQLKADAAKATAEAQALGSQIEGQSARLKGLRAELAEATAKRDKADLELKAQLAMTQRGVNVARAQKQAELAKIEAEIQSQATKVHNIMAVLMTDVRFGATPRQ